MEPFDRDWYHDTGRKRTDSINDEGDWEPTHKLDMLILWVFLAIVVGGLLWGLFA